MSLDGIKGIFTGLSEKVQSATTSEKESTGTSIFEDFADNLKASAQDIKDDLAEAGEHFSNGEIFKGLAKSAEAAFEAGTFPLNVDSKLDEES